MYAGNPQYLNNPAAMGLQMQMAMGGINSNTNPNFFYFTGNSISLQSRLNSMNDQEANRIVDATIVVTGRQIKPMNMCCLISTAVCGGFIIIPLFFMCCDWWKNCVYPAYDIDVSVYMSLQKLLRGSNLKNISLTVVDSTFGQNKAGILYQHVSQSRVNGFTFINGAGNYDCLNDQYSSFSRNMKPIKGLSNVMSDIRWGTQISL